MKEKDKTQKQHSKELTRLRQRIAELEASGRKRNQFEEALRQERNKAQHYLDIAEVMLVALNKKGEITLINRKGNQILEYPEGELLGRNWFTTNVPSHRRKKIKSGFLKLMAGEVKLTEFYENPALTKSGTERIIAWHNSLLKDAQGNITGTLSSGEDITLRKQAEAALRDSEERYKTLFDEALVGICLADAETGIIIDCNEALAALVRRERAELIGRPQKILHPPQDNREAFSPTFKQHLTNKEGIILETQVITRTGDIREVEIKANFLDLQDRKVLQGLFHDITERKQTEEALRKSEDKYRTILENIEEGYYEVDLAGNFTFLNDAMCRIWGYPKEELIGMNNRQYTDKENAKRVFQAFNEVYRSGKIGKGYDYEIIKKDGTRSYAEASISLRKDSSGKAIGFRGIIRDITERKQAEAQLRESQQRFQGLVETLSDWIWEVDQIGVYTYASPKVRDLLGYEPEEVLGKTPFDLMPPEEAERAKSAFERLLAARQPIVALENTNRHKDGRLVVFETSGMPFFESDGQFKGYRGVDRDITERKRLQETLDKEREELKLIIDSSPIIVFYKDKDGRFIRVNKLFAEALKRPEEDLVGKTVFDLYSPQIAQGMTDDDQVVIQSGRPKLNIIEQYESASGIRWVQTDKIPIFDKDGILIGLMGFAQDITERKRAEKKIAWLANYPKFNPMPIVEVGQNGQLTYVNPATQLLLPDLEKRQGGHPFLAELEPYFVNLKKKREIYSIREVEVGGRWYSQVITLPDPEHIRIYATDITVRKQAEEALRGSEEKYRDLVENINDIIYATDESGIVTYISPAIESISGYIISEIIGNSFFDFVYEDDISSMKDKFQQDMSGQAAAHEYRMMTKAGDIRWVRTSSRPFFKGDRIVGLRGILTDITARRKAEEEIKRGYEQLQETLHSTVKALASTVEMKDQYTAGHQPRVTQLACAIADEMGLPPEQIEGIRMAASIHDIGKIMVPAEILNKPGPLTEIQYEMIKMHPRAGYDILKGLKLPWPVAQIILQHHERMDGSGYPQRLSGEKIMVEARILAVANVVEAMNAHRPYRPAYDIQEALAEISKNRGTLYDAAVVDACLRLFTEKGFILNSLPR